MKNSQNINPLVYNGHLYEGIALIHNPDCNAGLSVLMTYALNGIKQSLARNWLPVINFDNQYNTFFYSPKHGENIWEYFWNPVMGLSYKDVEAHLKHGKIKPDQIKRFKSEDIFFWHTQDKERIATFWLESNPVDPSIWMKEKRKLGRYYVKKFIDIKENIKEKASNFSKQNFNNTFLFTVHIRGTDFSYAEPTNHKKYFKKIEEIIKRKNLQDYQVFLATDQTQFVGLFKKHFGSKLITYNSARGSSFIAPFKLQQVDPYKKGEDVLIDILLLSEGDHILKCAASVGEYATWFSNNIEITDFALESRYVNNNHFLCKTGYEKLGFIENSHQITYTAARRWLSNYLELKVFKFKNDRNISNLQKAMFIVTYIISIIIREVRTLIKKIINLFSN